MKKLRFEAKDDYLLEHTCKNPPASYNDYSYGPRKVTEKEAEQWRSIYKMLYTDCGRYNSLFHETKTVKYIHITNLIMFCGVRACDTHILYKNDGNSMIAYKTFCLEVGSQAELNCTLLDSPIKELAKLLSTMKGHQKVDEEYCSNGDKRLHFYFECEKQLEDKNEDK